MDSYVVTSFLVGHIYVVISLKGNECGTYYWLEHFLDGEKALNVSLTNSNGIDSLIGFMVIKGEYLKLDERI